MSIRAPSARLFVAVDPPAEVRAALEAWARTAARTLRTLDADLLHVTVCFLGERPLQEVDSIAAELEACERPAVELSLGAPLWLPPRRPRALAVELHDEQGTLTSIHREVVARLALDGDERFEAAGRSLTGQASSSHASGPQRPSGGRRPQRFRPHVTVARMRGGEAPRERSLPPTPVRLFAPAELVLYRSWLSPEGASYDSLAAAPLG